MNHTKYMELLERVEGEIAERKDWDPRDLAVAVVQALMPELDAPAITPVQREADIDQTIHELVAKVDELDRVLTQANDRSTGLAKRVNDLDTFTNRRVQALHERIQKLESAAPGDIFGALERVLREGARVAEGGPLCWICKRPVKACTCPTLKETP